MATFASDWLNEIQTRDNEITLLVDHARGQLSNNERLFNSLCRSSTIMLYAHFEGALKSAIKSLIADINRNGGYCAANESIKKIFLASMLSQYGKDIDTLESNQRRKRLDSILSPLNAPQIDDLDVWPGGKNPTADIYSQICQKFGCKDIFRKLENSDLEAVMFSGTKSEKIIKIAEIETDLSKSLVTYPYTIEWKAVGENTPQIKSKSTIFQDFVNNTMKPRHDIAHGATLDNPLSIDEIEDALIRLKALKLIFYMTIAS